MIRLFATVFAALTGLAFGSFLNVCLSRWPEGQSIVTPRSRCPRCGHTLAWFENVPLVSWLALRGRCRACGVWIGLRYPLVELAVGTLWGVLAWRLADWTALSVLPDHVLYREIARTVGQAIFCWLLVALAALDAEHLWLPDWLTWPGMAMGLAYSAVLLPRGRISPLLSLLGSAALPFTAGNAHTNIQTHIQAGIAALVAMVAAAALILFIRWTYKLIRKREGIGLGDAKLMAMLAAWLGLSGALLSFVFGITLGTVVALIALALPSTCAGEGWALHKLPLGTFLCIGALFATLYGQPILAAYLRWCGF
ncbi:MAG TPA: prepilin peptidase [Terracidiphilus sp.]|jgi:leader peptidase (prepilin peptidase)/N-methyltransferase|nr:prepilin peptidase [Terracidiphilus sp.]